MIAMRTPEVVTCRPHDFAVFPELEAIDPRLDSGRTADGG
jgi:hypothetical protein